MQAVKGAVAKLQVIKCFFLQGNKWSRSYREVNQHPSLPWNVITHGFLDPSAFPESYCRKKSLRGSVPEPRNDSRESGDPRESANRFARIGPSEQRKDQKAFSTGLWCIPGFGTGFVFAPSPQNCRQKIVEKCSVIFCAKLSYAPSGGSKEI